MLSFCVPLGLFTYLYLSLWVSTSIGLCLSISSDSISLFRSILYFVQVCIYLFYCGFSLDVSLIQFPWHFFSGSYSICFIYGTMSKLMIVSPRRTFHCITLSDFVRLSPHPVVRVQNLYKDFWLWTSFDFLARRVVDCNICFHIKHLTNVITQRDVAYNHVYTALMLTGKWEIAKLTPVAHWSTSTGLQSTGMTVWQYHTLIRNSCRGSAKVVDEERLQKKEREKTSERERVWRILKERERNRNRAA